MPDDLHLHSTASDGAESPAAIVRRAAAAGCEAVALADHGTGAGLAEACDAALAARIAFLPAVEFAVRDAEGIARLIAYGADAAPAGARPPAAEAQSCPAAPAPPDPDTGPRLTLADAVAAVRESGGCPVLAHPGFGIGADRVGPRLLAAVEAGIAGVEAWHPAHDAATAAHLAGLARRLDLVATGGSGCHGPGRFGDPPGRAAGAPLPAGTAEALRRRWLAGPLLLVVGGEVGTGKSTLARHAAALLGATHLASDPLRESLFPSASVGGPAKYSREASGAVFRVLLAEAELALRAGQPVVCDAVFRERRLHEALLACATRAGARTAFVDTTCDAGVQRARLAARAPGAEHGSEAGPAVLDLMRKGAAEAPDAYGPFHRTPALRAGAGACCVADSTPGAESVRILGARTPLAMALATALHAHVPAGA